MKYFKCNECGQRFCITNTTNNDFYCPHCKSDNLKLLDTNPFLKYTDKLAGTLWSKNQAYGDSFTKSLNEDGLLVLKIRLGDKFNRISQLIKE